MPVDIARLGPDARAQAERQLGTKRKRTRIPREDKAGLWIAAWRRYHEAHPSTGMEPTWEPEWRLAPPRRWRFDWAVPIKQLAVEVDGGRWAPGGGKHGSDADREKLNAAAALGWRVFRFSPQQLTEDPEQCVRIVEEAL